MLLPFLVLLLPQSPPDSSWAESGVQVLTADGFEWSHSLEGGRLSENGLQLAIPTTTRSPVRKRAIRTSEGCAVRIFGGIGIQGIDDLSFSAIPHRADQRVGFLESGEPMLVGPPTLPRRLESSRGNEVSFVAWLDGVEAVGTDVFLVAPDGVPEAYSWVVAGASGAAVIERRQGGFEPRLRLATIGYPPSRWNPRPRARVEVPRVDQAYLAEIVTCPEAVQLLILKRRIGRAQVEAQPASWSSTAVVPVIDWAEDPRPYDGEGVLEDRGLLEVWFEAPPHAKEGKSWTIVADAPRYLNLGQRMRHRFNTAHPPAPRPEPIPQLEPGFLIDEQPFGVHFEGPDEQLDIRPTMGPGAAWGDVDGDGWVDLYVVQGAGRAGVDPLPNRLYLNREGTHWMDATESSGTGHTGAGMGALFFDADGDGDLDLYVANYGPDALFLNDGSGKFTDVSAAVGVGGDLWSASVCAADYDKDGDLDLYVTSYLDYDLAKMPPAEELGRYQREDPVEMLPFAFPGQRNTFLRNDTVAAPAEGEPPFRFTDVTQELGLLDEQGRGMQAVFWDFDADGDEDLYVANDVSFNVLFRNEGDGTFKDISFSTGLDDPRGGMGLAVGDADLDGDEDLFLTNWELEANALYINNAKAPNSSKTRRSTFRDGTVRAGLGPASIGVTSWGAVFFDAENDGDLDLFIANGYTSPDYESTGICVGQPNLYFENRGGGRFREATAEAGRALLVELASRSASACDYDQDGRVDLFVTANNGRAQLLSNRRVGAGHWLGVRLRGTGGNTHAIGAVVTVFAGERELTRSLRAGTGYLSGNPPELHFGLGDAKGIDRVTVRWPSGRTTEHSVDAVDAWVTLVEE